MLTYVLSRRGSLPAYDYLYRCIRRDILAGRLKTGEKLPSKRALAGELGVCVATVENAYAQLAAEGYIRTKERSGYFVLPVMEQRNAPAGQPRQGEGEPCERAWLLDFKANHVEQGKFPFTVWARLMRQVLSEEDKELLRPCPPGGVYALRTALADYLYRARGLSVLPEQIVVGAGTEYLYTLMVQLLGREKIYGVEDPGYDKVARIYRANGAQVRYLGVDGGGMVCAEAEESGAEVLHLSPGHHFPTGVVMPVGRRQELLRWAEEDGGRAIIEDDYDSEFRLSGRPIPTLQGLDHTGRVLYVNTFSKTLSPAFRISYMVLPPALAERYRDKLGFYACTVSSLEQYTLARFISGGYFERHISRMKTFYRAKRDAVAAAIEESPLGGRSQILAADAGLHFLLELDTDLEDEELERRAADAGVRLSCLSSYVNGNHPVQTHRVVVNYSGLDPEKLPEGLDRLAALM